MVADLQLAGENALLTAVAQAPAAPRTDLDNPLNSSLGACERDALQALAEHADEHDLRGDKRFLHEDGGDAGDGDRQVRADAPSNSELSEPYRMRAPPRMAASRAMR